MKQTLSLLYNNNLETKDTHTNIWSFHYVVSVVPLTAYSIHPLV